VGCEEEKGLSFLWHCSGGGGRKKGGGEYVSRSPSLKKKKVEPQCKENLEGFSRGEKGVVCFGGGSNLWV